MSFFTFAFLICAAVILTIQGFVNHKPMSLSAAQSVSAPLAASAEKDLATNYLFKSKFAITLALAKEIAAAARSEVRNLCFTSHSRRMSYVLMITSSCIRPKETAGMLSSLYLTMELTLFTW